MSWGRSLVALAAAGMLAAAEPDNLFATRVQPVLKQHCLGCHGEGETFGKLDLRTREGLLRGGQRGPAIVLGAASKSLLVAMIEHRAEPVMPPEKEKRLAAESIDALRRWIDAGAPWGQDQAAAGPKWSYQPEDLWAFQPVKRHPAPAVAPIDFFLDRKLRERGLEPAPPADRVTLIRRATYDLTGLPPSPEEVDAFEKDQSPDAFERVVERLLASPGYGERWGRHWLDVVRYADSDGYSNDYERPNAWRYRDYVIRSFNQDKPYDRFILEQIAGDELDPGDPESLVATGFLRMGPWEHTGMSVEAVTRQMFLDDVTHNTAATFLALTLNCARCHDHKFDPLPTRDYYRWQAVFANTVFDQRPAPFRQWEKHPGLEAGLAGMQEVIRRNDAKIAGYDETVKQTVLKKHGVARVQDLPAGVLAEALRKKDSVSPEEFERLKVYQKRRELYRRSVDRYRQLAYSVKNQGGAETYVLVGGNLRSPGEKVSPAAPGVAGGVEIPGAMEGRRLALARWIASPSNPLTARVMVNRIWHYHFGKGLAATPNNFGKMGKRPTHPELLDWLAGYFVETGWSVKQMHRLMLRSAAYRRGSRPADPRAAEVDPDNQLLSYFSPRRLEAEELRDSILAVAGELSPDAGGPGTLPEINEDVAVQPRHIMGTLAPAWRPSATRRERNRRTIYTYQKRSLVDPMVEVFNGPSLEESCERRDASNVPTQVFALFNGKFAHDMSLALAARIEKLWGDREQQIEHAFRLAYGRPPGEGERRLAIAHLEKMEAHHRGAPPSPRPQRQPLVRAITSELTGARVDIEEDADTAAYEPNLHPGEVSPATRALADLALVLLNSNEFVYVY